PREISQDSVITAMARELDLNFSIVGGKLDRYLDDVFGTLIINVPDRHVDTVLEYLGKKKLYWQILGGSGCGAETAGKTGGGARL
ncbi:MAG: NIL domain-containing protein, partial [Planctomycetes bacterium]|nr:NIL domain-containing protein [Planctomycetota bacterium]